jgi:hypothetical protein
MDAARSRPCCNTRSFFGFELGSQDSNYTILVHDNASGLNAAFAGHVSADFKGYIARAGINYYF